MFGYLMYVRMYGKMNRIKCMENEWMCSKNRCNSKTILDIVLLLARKLLSTSKKWQPPEHSGKEDLGPKIELEGNHFIYFKYALKKHFLTYLLDQLILINIEINKKKKTTH